MTYDEFIEWYAVRESTMKANAALRNVKSRVPDRSDEDIIAALEECSGHAGKAILLLNQPEKFVAPKIEAADRDTVALSSSSPGKTPS